MFRTYNALKAEVQVHDREVHDVQDRLREAEERAAMYAAEQETRMLRLEREREALARRYAALQDRLKKERATTRDAKTLYGKTRYELARRTDEFDMWRHHTINVEARLRKEKELRALDQTYLVDAERMRQRMEHMEATICTSSELAQDAVVQTKGFEAESKVLRRAVVDLDDAFRTADGKALTAEGGCRRLLEVAGRLRDALEHEVGARRISEDDHAVVQRQLYRANRFIADIMSGRATLTHGASTRERLTSRPSSAGVIRSRS
eukprot:g1782.t1